MTTIQESHDLYTLGRRVERLFLLGIVLIVLSFAETYLITANSQLSRDQSAAAIIALQEKLTTEEQHLTTLFQSKLTPPKQEEPAVESSQSKERARLVARTRQQLGLPEPPPPKPREPPIRPQKVPTYGETLDTIISEITQATHSPPEDLAKYRDVSKSPRDLIMALQRQKEIIESKPTAVWGIQTPRLFQLQYAGLDYKIPLGFLSTTLAVALAFLIVGWLGSVYMTRQRELLSISELDDYRLAFPHILNGIPVRFVRYESLWHPIRKQRPKFEGVLNRVVSALIRTVILLFFSLSMVCAYIYSIYQLWIINAEEISILLIGVGFLAAVMTIQTVALALQEFFALHGKEFSVV